MDGRETERKGGVERRGLWGDGEGSDWKGPVKDEWDGRGYGRMGLKVGMEGWYARVGLEGGTQGWYGRVELKGKEKGWRKTRRVESGEEEWEWGNRSC